MNNQEIVSKSKFLSLILRHQPEKANIVLDESGWALVSDILTNCRVSKAELDEIVKTNNKQRFKYNEDETKIRANQGHSIDVDLNLKPAIPPDFLFHGTADRFVDSISNEGLKKMNRQYVHLSNNIITAESVGKRHGNPIIYTVDSKRMREDGYVFYRSDNGVWLTDNVPAQYLVKINT